MGVEKKITKKGRPMGRPPGTTKIPKNKKDFDSSKPMHYYESPILSTLVGELCSLGAFKVPVKCGKAAGNKKWNK